MNKFGLFEFFSKLSSNKEAQNSLNAILKNLLPGLIKSNNGDKANDIENNINDLQGGGNGNNNENNGGNFGGNFGGNNGGGFNNLNSGEKRDRLNEASNLNLKSKKTDGDKVNFNANVYLPPVNESLYKELIKRHDDISKTVLKKDNNGKNS